MIEESPMDEVTDLIANVEMHRKEIERESGLDASRTYALGRLQEALRQVQETAQNEGATDVRTAIADALSTEIKRVQSLSRSSGGGQRPPQEGGNRPPQNQQPRNFRRDGQRNSSKQRGRRPMGGGGGRGPNR